MNGHRACRASGNSQSKRVTLRFPEVHSGAADIECWNIRGLEYGDSGTQICS